MKQSTNKLLQFVIAIALALRFVGIMHSFPFVFHPDEPTIVRSALGVRFDPNPGHFDWPHLYIYFNYFVYMVFAKIRVLATNYQLLAPVSVYFPQINIINDDNTIFYLITRLITATLGALTTIPVYFTARKLFNKDLALKASLAIAVIPFHVWHSHYSLPDVPMVFLLACGMYFSAHILLRGHLKDYFWAGIFVGLAASVKYNGAIGILFIVLAHLLRVFYEPQSKFYIPKGFGNLFVSGVAVAFAFVLGTPYAILDFKTFIRTDGPMGALWQFTNVGKLPLSLAIPQFFDVLFRKLLWDVSPTFLVAFVFSALTLIGLLCMRALKRATFVDRSLLFLVIPTVFFIFYVSTFEKARSHYLMISYPSLAILAVWFADMVLGNIKVNSTYKKFLWGLFFIVPLYLSAKGSYLFYRDDTRILLYRWLDQNKRMVYYHDNDLEQAIEKANPQSYKLGRSFMTSQRTGSTLVLSYGSPEELPVLKYKEIYFISNELRTGPNIKIYETN